MVAPRGGMHGCSGGGGHVWLLLGGMCGCSGGACVVALGGACVVALGGMRGCSGKGGVHGFFNEIRSMSRRYASYWNAFLLFNIVPLVMV